MLGITREDVLATVHEFNDLGGASLDLVAWELDQPPGDIVAIWDDVIHAGLLIHIGTDHGEQMYGLSTTGHNALAR